MKFETAIRLVKGQLKKTRRCEDDPDEINSSTDTEGHDNNIISDSNNLVSRFNDKKKFSFQNNFDTFGIKSIGDTYAQYSFRDGPLKEFDDAKVISIASEKVIQNNREASLLMADRILDKITDKPINFQEFRKRILPRIELNKRELSHSLIKLESQKIILTDNNKEREGKIRFLQQSQSQMI